MASSSSSTIMASSDCSYDVFLSFRGEDTRYSFTDHLYEALKRAGVSTFRDDEEIKRGEELKPEIEKAIKASRASIVVLSKSYATSTWCLDELLLILKQRSECTHFVLPVFYHVMPTDIRNQKGSFKIERKPSTGWINRFISLWKTVLMQVAYLTGLTLWGYGSSTRWTDGNVQQWKKALTQVADLSGEVVSSDSGPETSILKKIVETIYNKLDRKEVHLPINITGMATRYKEIGSWLHKRNCKFLIIFGMGGSGKTTLAKYIYDSNWRTFEYASFVEDIDSRFNEPNGLVTLQEQLLNDILGGNKRETLSVSVSQGMRMIKDVVKDKRALIVLDDITKHDQVDALLGKCYTYDHNSRSKIIITTRIKDTDKWFDLPYWSYQKYEMRLLNDEESLELLSCHAFGSKIPTVTFKELLLEAVKYCEGNPLAFQVLGSSMFKNNTIQNWKSQLNLLEKDIDSRIQDVLERSYMSLPYNSNKELFLHIACFFIGKDMDYVEKILEPDYSARAGIKTLINRCLLFVLPNKKLMMHRLIQEMGKNIVRQESPKFPEERSRVWLSGDSYEILIKGEGSKRVEGLALDMKLLKEGNFAHKSSDVLTTDALKRMDHLKLLQLNFVTLSGPYENFSKNLRWLCWLGFDLPTIPADLYMGNLVAIDMSYSKLKVFEPPEILLSLRILNLKDSQDLTEMRQISRIPNLEILVLWNCNSLVNVCEKLGGLTSLATLNMTGCKNLFNREEKNTLATSTSGGVITEQPTVSFPLSLHQLFLKDCHIECTRSFPLSFRGQPLLQYLNLGNSRFESLPSYDHMKSLRVLDLSFCSRLKYLLRLPGTLAELYVYDCKLLERITFESPRFTLQEIGYEGCINLNEVEGYVKLVPIAELDETDLGRLRWLKDYQNCEVSLVGDELTVGRSRKIQMLNEFGIMSTSVPYIKDPRWRAKYKSKSSSLCFDVPLCPKNKRLKGILVTFQYWRLLDQSRGWFCKISTSNGVDLMYNPKVFGKPESRKSCIWFSYWPIGNKLNTGDKVHVSIVTTCAMYVHRCGVSLVYSDEETMENEMRWEEILGGDLSGFELSTGVNYLCRRDFFELMEVGRSTPDLNESRESVRLTPDWFRTLVGDNIDYTEVRGWRKTGRPKQVNPSFTELRTVRCIMDGPQMDDVYRITEMSKSSIAERPGFNDPYPHVSNSGSLFPYSEVVLSSSQRPRESSSPAPLRPADSKK